MEYVDFCWITSTIAEHPTIRATQKRSYEEIKMRKRTKGFAITLATGLAVIGLASPAMAANYGARSCPATWTVETASFSSGTTTHVHFGATTSTSPAWSNGNNIIHRYWSALNSTYENSVNTSGSFSGGTASNYVTCIH
jgi:hypothetical protein